MPFQNIVYQMIFKKIFFLHGYILFFLFSEAQSYPQRYFRSPLNIPMQLVANFGEIRANHWHMGLDIRTRQRVNLPVQASADGYISRVSVEPGGFGQAIYISHPNGYTTVYGHLNSFFPALSNYVKQHQYEEQSWKINLIIPANLFPVKKGNFIALSGSTGASEGPHVHFEIRNTKTENCLNPLLFKFPVADAVPPTLLRLAMYDRNKSTYEQLPQIFAVKKLRTTYSVAAQTIHTYSNKVSFAIEAIDKFSNRNNHNGIYSTKILMDGKPVSEFVLDNISYNNTRYINAQLDYSYKERKGIPLQHISPLPGTPDVVYNVFNGDGMIHLNDEEEHSITIEVKDADGNTSKLKFNIQRNESLQKNDLPTQAEQFLPNNVNVFERENFELYTTEKTIYDTVAVNFSSANNSSANAISSVFNFLSAAVPSHDSVMVRIKPMQTIPEEWKNRVVIKNISGSKTFIKKGEYQRGWYAAKFRQFGTYQLFIDDEPPTMNAPPSDLSKANRIVFIPKDNFNVIKNFRAEIDGQWLRFSNDKGKTWIYFFDEHFPKGEHELKVTVEDEAGNTTTKIWKVKR